MREKANSLKILILTHRDLIPPALKGQRKLAEKSLWKTEYDVARSLLKQGHQVKFCGLLRSFTPLKKAIKKFKPDLVFNMMEEYAGQSKFEVMPVQALEALRVPFTGCSSKALVNTRSKVTCHGFLKEAKVPQPVQYDKDKVKFPVIVKLSSEHASLGIQSSSVVQNEKELKKEIARFESNYDKDLVFEEFIAGREFCVGIFKSKSKIRAMHPIETVFLKTKNPYKQILTEKLKWDLKLRRKRGVHVRTLKDEKLIRRLKSTAMKAFNALELDAYARIDLRVCADGAVKVIDVNPNADLGWNYDLCESCRVAGVGYDEMIKLCLGSL